MKSNKQKGKLKIIYDIIPPHLLKDIVLAEKKVSKMVKVAYLFLKTSKYGSIFLILSVAIFGGVVILGFSPKIETAEIYPARHEGNWENMEMGLTRELSDKANILEFSPNNSAGVVKFEEEVIEAKPDIFLLPEEEDMDQLEPAEDTEDTEEEAVHIEDVEPAKENPEEKIIKKEIEEPVISDDTEEAVPVLEPQEDANLQEEQSSIPSFSENPDEGVSFLERTKNLFFALKASAEESVSDENPEELSSDTVPISNEPMELTEDTKEETVRVENTEPTAETKFPIGDLVSETLKPESDEEERFEDYSGIILPDVDGNLFSKARDEITADTQTVFTEELTAVYSDFSVPKKKGELRKIKIGFSFASLEKENEDDEIIVSWSLDDKNWNSASEFVLDKTYSNKDNNGYFYVDIFDAAGLDDAVLEWEDIENIKIKFSYLTNNNKENHVPFFLDAVWLKTESEKPDEEIDEEKIEVLSREKDFKMGENPEFRFKYKKEKNGFLASVGEALGVVDYWKDINLTAEIISPSGEVFEIPSEIFGDTDEIFTLEKDGEILMKLKKDNRFKPGLYKIILKIEEEGNLEIFEQDFTWGVLAVNVNKSIYFPNEVAYLQMGALRNDGRTICDADLVLSIKYQASGEETILSTEDGTIQYSGQCDGNNVTDVPDYFAYYTTGEAGIYEMKLTNLDNGYEITDAFEVRDSVPFDVERIGPSRIYPPADYGMVLKIKVNQDFVGFIQERVPVSFVIIEQELKIKNQETGEFEIYESQFITQDENGVKLLKWHNFDLKQNDELEIRYTFDAPNVSPDLHSLGPLGFYE